MSDAKDENGERAGYATPELTVHGDLVELTRANGKGAFADNPNKPSQLHRSN